MLPEALVHWIEAAVAGVADGQAPTAVPAQQQALKQTKALARRAAEHAGFAVGAVGRQALAIGHEPVPGDVAGMVVVDGHLPRLRRHPDRPGADLAVVP